MPTITVNEEIPGPDEFIALRAAAGLSPRTPEAARLGLPRSLFAVCVRREAELIGMGRIVGDGGCSFQIVDIAVHPDYQRQGLGTRIMEALMHYIREICARFRTRQFAGGPRRASPVQQIRLRAHRARLGWHGAAPGITGEEKSR